MNTLGGFLAIRNGIDLDYCFVEAIKSLLPICQQVVVADIESSDGTLEFLQEWELKEENLRVVKVPWTNPVRDKAWWPGVLNKAREYLGTDMAITLDADEVLHDNSYERVLKAVKDNEALMCYRYNFWRDPQHLIPKGVCCGTDVIRVGPRRCFFPSDYRDERALEIWRLKKWVPDPPQIYHYGFLRKRDAFFRKAKVVQNIWAGEYDPRLAAVENKEGNWMADPRVVEWTDKLVPFTMDHPEIIRPWLRERGWKA